MPPLKHNQKVTCRIDNTVITDARISINEDGRRFICQNATSGDNAKNTLGYKYSWAIGREGEKPEYYHIHDLRIVEEEDTLNMTNLKTIFRNIPIPSTDGKELVAGNKLFAWTDSYFVSYGLSHEEDRSVATTFEVFELTKNSTFKEMFTTPEKQWVTQSQMLAFIKENRDKLRQNNCATFFLLKKDNEFFVADVNVSSVGLVVIVHRFEFDYVWLAEFRRRLVCPQVAFEKGNIPAYRLTTDSEQREAEAIEYLESLGYEVTKWEPKNKMEYFIITNDGKVEKRFWADSSGLDKARLAFGNCFRTEALAQSALLKVKEALTN